MSNLKKNLANKWDFITQQAEEQVYQIVITFIFKFTIFCKPSDLYHHTWFWILFLIQNISICHIIFNKVPYPLSHCMTKISYEHVVGAQDYCDH